MWLLVFIFVVLVVICGCSLSWFKYDLDIDHLDDFSRKKYTKESLEQCAHRHSPHWEYIKDLVSWRIRLRLSRFRGKERALRWRIKVFAFFSGLGPQVAQWILEEYMITAKIEERPASTDDWLCAKCGAYNPETALFCKDCGEYK